MPAVGREYGMDAVASAVRGAAAAAPVFGGSPAGRAAGAGGAAAGVRLGAAGALAAARSLPFAGGFVSVTVAYPLLQVA